MHIFEELLHIVEKMHMKIIFFILFFVSFFLYFWIRVKQFLTTHTRESSSPTFLTFFVCFHFHIQFDVILKLCYESIEMASVEVTIIIY